MHTQRLTALMRSSSALIGVAFANSIFRATLDEAVFVLREFRQTTTNGALCYRLVANDVIVPHRLEQVRHAPHWPALDIGHSVWW